MCRWSGLHVRRNILLGLSVAMLWSVPKGHADELRDMAAEVRGNTGGLIVQLGCSDLGVLAPLLLPEGRIVHTIDTNADRVEKKRREIQSLGMSDEWLADTFDGEHLPYVDNLVNTIVSGEPIERLKVSREELLRVLVPGGVAYFGPGERSEKIVKPWPDDIDQWTHFLYDASNNAVAKDRQVGSPRGVQWVAGPRRTRDHDALASLSAMTSTGGRIFYIFDEGPTSLIHHPPQWRLIARDAFNGTIAWKRDIPSWISHLYYFRSGPVWLGRRLVSTEGRVYVPLGLETPVSALDAATGETLLTYSGSEKAEEILYHDGTLLVATGDPKLMNRQAKTAWIYSEYTVEGERPNDRAILAYEAESGKLLWKKGGRDLPYLLPLSLTAAGDRVFYMDGQNVCCADLATGKEQWRAPFPTEGLFLRNYAPTVVAADGVLLCLTMDRLTAYSIAEGKRLWETKGYKGYTSPGDLFVIDGVAWTLPVTEGGVVMPKEQVLGNGGQIFQGFDVQTGEVVKTFEKKDVWPSGHHHRCYRNRATEQFLMTSRRGLEFIDLDGDDHMMNWWVRGLCQYGVMPSNGLIYVPPNPCRCFNLILIIGFYTLTAKSSFDAVESIDSPRLTKGPAYRPQAGRSDRVHAVLRGKIDGQIWHPPVRDADSDDWPTYRRDITRSASTDSSVPVKLSAQWETDLGGRLTSPVMAGGKLLVGSPDGNFVACLDAKSGKELWRFLAGGGIDSPPTLCGDLALFGSRDGTVYAVRLTDGRLAWRFRAAPCDRRLMADGRLESVWPVHGSVLVLDGVDAGINGSGPVVYCAAGRSSYLDGGIFLYGLDVASGKVRYEARVQAAPDPIGTEGTDPEMTPALVDVLVSNGTSINMRHVRFDRTLTRQPSTRLDTLVSTTGLLEDAWAHRHNTTLGFSGSVNYTSPNSALRYSPENPFGKLICFDATRAFGAQTIYTFLKNSPSMYPPTHKGHLHQKYSNYEPSRYPIGTRLFAQDNRQLPPVETAAGAKKPRNRSMTSTAGHKWSTGVPLQIRAMVLAGDTIFAAGWVDSVEIHPEAAAAVKDAGKPLLWALSTDDGRRLAQIPLDERPAFDGLIAAGGRLYLTTQAGKVVCLGD